MAKYRTQCCNEVIESKHVYDFKECSCGNSFVDGGDEYSRLGSKDGRFPLRLEE